MAQCASDTLNAPADKLLLSELIKLGGHSAISGRYRQLCNMTALLIIIVLIVVLVLVFKNRTTREHSDSAEPRHNTNSFESYPDRSDNMIMLNELAERAADRGDYETANLNYAKLIEAMRQQNENSNGALTPVLKDSMRIYSEFRKLHGLSYPSQFAQNIEGEIETDRSEMIPELLKSATKLSSTDINGSIKLIEEALDIDDSNFQTHKKLCSYLYDADRFIDAEAHLMSCYQRFDEFERGEILDYLAMLNKRQKNDLKAIELDCHSLWYSTLFNSAGAYRSVEPFCEDIKLNRKYRDAELCELLNSKIREFWGKKWLANYLKDYDSAFRSSRGQANQNDVLISKIHDLIGDLTFDRYKIYIQNLIKGGNIRSCCTTSSKAKHQ